MAVSKSNKKMMIYSALVLLLLFTYAIVRDVSEPISLSQATKLLNENSISNATVVEDTVYLYAQDGSYRIPLSILSVENIKNLIVDTKGRSTFPFYFLFIFLVLVVVGALFYLYSKSEGGIKGFKSLKHDDPEDSSAIVAMTSDVLFRDVAGIDDVKEELFEIISFLKDFQNLVLECLEAYSL